MAYKDFKDLSRRVTSDKVLCDKAFETANTWKHDGYKHGLALLFHEWFDKKAGDTSTHRDQNYFWWSNISRWMTQDHDWKMSEAQGIQNLST